MYGRSPAGHSVTSSTHHPALTITAPAATARPSKRVRCAPASHASPNAGSTRNACIIFVRNPNPTHAPASTSHRMRPSSIARTVAYALAVSSSTSSASGLLNRNISTATGVSASTTPASSAAASPATRFTAAYSSHTVATPISACGTRMLHGCTPKIRADRPITHTDAGVLSTVIPPAASVAPNSSAFQLAAPACAAAE